MPYVYDQAWTEERRRLAGLENLYDPGTIAALEQTGVGPGWRVLEVAGGGGSIAEWLAKHVLPGGHVVATDLDTRFLETIDGIEVRKHDIVAGEVEPNTYDLVHSRCLLEHLPQRDLVLNKMTETLKPGGWIVLDDYDFAATLCGETVPVYPAEHGAVWRRVNEAILKLMQAAGYDPDFGRRLPFELMALGYDNVGASVRSTLIHSGTPDMDFARFTVEQLGPAVVSAGLLTEADVREALEHIADPNGAAMTIPLVTAWGRKPA